MFYDRLFRWRSARYSRDNRNVIPHRCVGAVSVACKKAQSRDWSGKRLSSSGSFNGDFFSHALKSRFKMHTAYRALRRPHDWKMGLTSRYILQTRIWLWKNRCGHDGEASGPLKDHYSTIVECKPKSSRGLRGNETKDHWWSVNSNVRSMFHALTIVPQRPAFNYLRKMSKRFRTICSISFQLARARACVWWNLSARYRAERKKARLTIKLQYCAWRFAERFRYPIAHTREQSWFNFSKGQRDMAEKRNGSCPILQVH